MHRSPRPSNVEIRADDRALTGHAGLLLTGELAARTDLVARLDSVSCSRMAIADQGATG